MYKAIEIAKYIVTKCVKDEYPISNLQLQKILYFIQRDFLRKGTQAFADNLEAWQFGPVVPEVYYHFCGFGAMPITSEYSDVLILEKDKETIDKIVCEKRKLYPWDLVEDTHRKGGAWDQTYQKGHKGIIDASLIRSVG